MPLPPSRDVLGYVVRRMSKTMTPGLSLAVNANNDIYARGFGYRSLEKGLPATPDTIYCIASITKPITAVAVMQLVEAGKLSLDDPADKYLPVELRVRGEPVRIWHLLSHTSGIPALGYAEALLTGYLGLDRRWLPFSEPMAVLEWLERGARRWAVATPGERFFYLNEGYVALGVIIERVSGVKFEEYVERNIFKPLGMSSSTLDASRAQSSPLYATPYDASTTPPQPAMIPTGITADGGAYSTVLDLVKFMSMLANRGRLGDTEILSPSSVEEMEKPRVQLPSQIWGNDSYGLGLIIYDGFPGGRLVGHSGSVYVHTGFAGYIRGKSVIVSVLANADPGATTIGMALAADAAGIDYHVLPMVRAEEAAEKLEGIYHGYEGTVRFRVKALGDALVIESLSRPGLQEVMVPERIEPPVYEYTVYRGGRRMKAVFTR
ncbi:serine hydrolase [Hyperthermus butylicus]|uniref:Beta-lactamase class C n=1 Tax=Hyperthermus butylicus (strain DSM 5456 / JCM 9403 / PLM1-5) TaxID=415426 RepID=A2BLL8_HYPBU|nr:serine hydrolase [Hyperthermus butylicus]ABM80879.1 Beta-lactamase class C [Hyperthermus butylicus DSM 5456]